MQIKKGMQKAKMSNNNDFVKYKDLLTIKEYDKETDKEKFTLIPLEDQYVISRYQKTRNMLEYGREIAVRKSVHERLIRVAKDLQKINQNYKLIIAYGFRNMVKQEKYFNEILEEVKDKFDDEMEMYEYIHEKIAVPSVSGHPTGGAVDAVIYDSKERKMLDFGCEILDYSTTKCYYINDEISEEAKKNRKMLRDAMLQEKFAPYDGEWWHFSYGDKEWAFYYKKKKALYNQVEASRIFNNESKLC